MKFNEEYLSRDEFPNTYEAADSRAGEHADNAAAILRDLADVGDKTPRSPEFVIAEALLAIEARLDEIAAYLSRRTARADAYED